MAREDAQEQSITVPAEDPKKAGDKDKATQDGKANGVPAGEGKTKEGKSSTKEDELSEEDLQLKNELEMLVERLKVSG